MIKKLSEYFSENKYLDAQLIGNKIFKTVQDPSN